MKQLLELTGTFPMRFAALFALLASMGTGSALAGGVPADQTLRGVHFVLRDPLPDAPEERRLRIHAATSAPLVLPDAHRINAGGRLELTVRGEEDLAFSQHFDLPSEHWKRWRGGWRYDDPSAEAGPVQSLRFTTSEQRGTRLGIRIDGSRGALVLALPDPGIEASVTLSFGSNRRYCVAFGSDGRVQNRPGSFKVGQAKSQGCPTPVNEGSLLALSYNVAGLPQPISDEDPETNTPLIAPRLNEFDLVLLQESWRTPDPNPLAPVRTYHEILEAASDHPFHSVPLPAPVLTDPLRPTAIVSDGLNRFSRRPFLPLVRERWTDCFGDQTEGAGDCFALKGFSVARMFVAPGLEIDVYNLHGEAGGSASDELLRADNYLQLAAFINEYSLGRAVLLGGDTNLHTRGDRIDPPDVEIWSDFLAATGLTDVCEALVQNECEVLGASQIDKFAFRSNSELAVIPLTHRFRDADFEREGGVPLSDHSPLEVEFSWQRVGAP